MIPIDGKTYPNKCWECERTAAYDDWINGYYQLLPPDYIDSFAEWTVAKNTVGSYAKVNR